MLLNLHSTFSKAAFWGAVLLLAAPPACAETARPFPNHTLYAAGSILPNNHTQAQLDDDVRAFYDDWKSKFVIPADTTADGRPRYRISFGSTNPARTVSEGQGYGMVIVALMAGHDPQAQVVFDGLYEFAAAFPSHIEARLMSFEVPEKEQVDSAFDGDADIAYGLMLAHAQWGSAGKVNYAAAANARIAGILAGTIGAQSRLPLLGDWVNDAGARKFTQFSPRSSDFITGHFRAYGRFTSDPVWSEVVAKTQQVIDALQAKQAAKSGLLPDFIVNADKTPRPAPKKFLEGVNDGAYYYNAGRDPWRIGTDALVNGDETSKTEVLKMAAFFKQATGGDPSKIRSGYALNGKPTKNSDFFTTFFVSPVGVAAMLDPGHQDFLNAIYDRVRATHEDYYEDSVTLQCLLVMSGNFWDPTLGNVRRE
jgi:endo-1,4-beta-D-glucanase Y